MVKHTQTIRRHQPTNCLSVFDHFVNLALKGLKEDLTLCSNDASLIVTLISTTYHRMVSR